MKQDNQKRAAFSVREAEELGLGSQSHIRRMIKADEIPVFKLGNRKLIPAWWIEDNFSNPDAA